MIFMGKTIQGCIYQGGIHWPIFWVRFDIPVCLGNKEIPLNCEELKRKLNVLEDVDAGEKELEIIKEEK